MPIVSHFRSRFLRTALMAAGLGLALPAGLLAQQEKSTGPKKELTEKVSEELPKIRTQIDGKNFDAALAIIDSLLRTVLPDSYDLAVLSQVKAQILLNKGEYAKSIQPLETALQVSEKNGYFEPKVSLEFTYYLAQLYAQEATNTKDPAALRKNYSKAAEYIERWIKSSPKPDPEKQLFFTSILYNLAQVDANNVDMALIKRTEAEAEKGLRMSIKPKDAFYVLLLASMQQQNKTKESAELLELLIKNFPNNKNYWQQLAGTYLNLQQDVRAALTIERAQKFDAMNTPKDNFNLVGIYFNMGQFEQAIDLLVKGLKDGSIEKEQRNYELLAAAYQQIKKEQSAIETLKEAIQLFPNSGSLYLQVAQMNYSLDKLDEAYVYAKQAVTKKLDKPWQAQTFLAYVCYELKKLDEALTAINIAVANPEGSKDAERLKKAIEDSIKERDAAAAAAHSPSTPKTNE